MRVAGHLYGGASFLKQLKVGETIARGVPTEWDTNNQAGISTPALATAVTDTLGIAEDAATYSTTQGDAEGLVTVDIRPDAIIQARMSGGATVGTSLTTLSNTAAETAGTVITDADVGTADMDGGTVWHLRSAASRMITTHSSGVSFTVTVPFVFDIAVGEEFLFCPWALLGDGSGGEDGSGALQMTSDFTEANGAIASGTGAAVSIVDLILAGALDSFVQFLLTDHVHRLDTT